MQTVACTHHWVIEEARARQSAGRCRRCGEERMFNNSVEIALNKAYLAAPGYSPGSAYRPSWNGGSPRPVTRKGNKSKKEALHNLKRLDISK